MKSELHPCVYIMTNKGNAVLYTGVTSNLFKRIAEHKHKVVAGFTSSYNVTKLVYYEEYASMEEAITREKQPKVVRGRKNQLDQQQKPGVEGFVRGILCLIPQSPFSVIASPVGRSNLM